MLSWPLGRLHRPAEGLPGPHRTSPFSCSGLTGSYRTIHSGASLRATAAGYIVDSGALRSASLSCPFPVASARDTGLVNQTGDSVPTDAETAGDWDHSYPAPCKGQGSLLLLLSNLWVHQKLVVSLAARIDEPRAVWALHLTVGVDCWTSCSGFPHSLVDNMKPDPELLGYLDR